MGSDIESGILFQGQRVIVCGAVLPDCAEQKKSQAFVTLIETDIRLSNRLHAYRTLPIALTPSAAFTN
jgi:hypothetical protein